MIYEKVIVVVLYSYIVRFDVFVWSKKHIITQFIQVIPPH